MSRERDTPPADYIDELIDAVIDRALDKANAAYDAERAAEAVKLEAERQASLSWTERCLALINSPKPEGSN